MGSHAIDKGKWVLLFSNAALIGSLSSRLLLLLLLFAKVRVNKSESAPDFRETRKLQWKLLDRKWCLVFPRFIWPIFCPVFRGPALTNRLLVDGVG